MLPMNVSFFSYTVHILALFPPFFFFFFSFFLMGDNTLAFDFTVVFFELYSFHSICYRLENT